jgi:hypothetical protein
MIFTETDVFTDADHSLHMTRLRMHGAIPSLHQILGLPFERWKCIHNYTVTETKVEMQSVWDRNWRDNSYHNTNLILRIIPWSNSNNSKSSGNYMPPAHKK